MSIISISKVYNSRNVILSLMKKQGYNISEYQGFSINEINTMMLNSQLDIIVSKGLAEDLEEKVEEKVEAAEEKKAEEKVEKVKKIYIKYYILKALKPNNLQEIIDDLFVVEEILKKSDTLYIIVNDDMNKTLISKVKHIWDTEGIFVVILPLERLQFNILDHILVPFHRVLSKTEEYEIKKKYNIINDNEFPELSRFDPVAKAIGIRPGEICEIMRPSKTSISAPYYRICV